jgi:hypothetical protein
MDRTSQTQKSTGTAAGAAEPGMSPGPTDAEVEAWAERVRLRRQAWVDGPTEEEKQEWQRRERARRAARLEVDAESGADNGGPTRRDPYYEEGLRLQRRYVREARLATEGLGVWVTTWPFRVLANLVSVGREWEEESLRPARRRWIPFYDDDV